MNDVRCGSIELEAMTAVWFIDWLYRFMISGLSSDVELLFSIVGGTMSVKCSHCSWEDKMS